MMVGLLLASLLCGVASVQTVIFFSTKRSDPPLHKISIAMLCAAYYYVVEHTGEQFPPSSGVEVLASMSVTTASDFIVGGLLIYTLAKSETNLSWTDSSFKMLIAYCVNTGIITGRPAKLTTHVLSYFRHDDSRSSHDMLASGELSPPIISMKLPEEQLSTPTINEIGLPLYKGGFTPKRVY
ncbi:hypothetical protein D9757_009209 [Collybiopsis confluens]|uniref:Uncharacterized protein n=1 Tax=Collybiopsis confluens TaxID=2823264 RepID=A0A8H5M3P5_9AGAR|nr:hypothetical protein D9757_009209 [Collybiopsis confluens]